LFLSLTEIEKKLKKQDSSVEFNIDKFINYLRRHPDMLKYEFGTDGNFVKIIVDPFRFLTFTHKSKKRQCNMSYGITELLNAYCKDNGNKVEVVMGNQSYCESEGFILPPTIDTTSKSVEPVGSDDLVEPVKPVKSVEPVGSDDLVEPVKPVKSVGHAALSLGGSKSRRKPARKTRRGRTRKSKSKTHRRRRHSRVRKHKKNTYTRRR
jgi:hypothetical protein